MALPEDHLAKFHKMTDAKELWDAIKSRFGRNDESKKMQKYILKQQFEGFSVSNTEGLHKGYDRFQSLLSHLEIHGAGVSTEDVNQKFLRSLPSACSTNEVSTAYCVPNLSGQNTKYEQPSSYSLLANQSSCPQLDHEDLEQIDEYDLEEMDLKWQVAMISMRKQKFYRRLVAKLQFDAKEPLAFDKTKVEWLQLATEQPFARECRIKDLKRTGEGTVMESGNTRREQNWTEGGYQKHCSDSEPKREQLSDASIEIKAYSQGLKKVEAQLVAHQQGQLWYEQKIKFMKIDLDDKTDVLTYHKKLLAEAQKEKEDLKAKFGPWVGDHRSDVNIELKKSEVLQSGFFMNKKMTVRQVACCTPPMIGNYMPSGPDVELDDSKFTYGPKQTQPNESESQTSEFDTCKSNISAEPSELVSKLVVNESNVKIQPKVWSDAPIIEEYESDSDDECVVIPTKQQETPSFANQRVGDMVKKSIYGISAGVYVVTRGSALGVFYVAVAEGVMSRGTTVVDPVREGVALYVVRAFRIYRSQIMSLVSCSISAKAGVNNARIHNKMGVAKRKSDYELPSHVRVWGELGLWVRGTILRQAWLVLA
ncbi:hypothetical protein Tco_0864874 [Tanacetum coccineum]